MCGVYDGGSLGVDCDHCPPTESCPSAGTILSEGCYPPGNTTDEYETYANTVANGDCTSTENTNTNDSGCPANPDYNPSGGCPTEGTFLGTTCLCQAEDDYATLYNLYADGNCGQYYDLVESDSSACFRCQVIQN